MELQMDDRGSDPVPSARAQLQQESGQDLGGTGVSPLSETDPIRLTDIDRVLEASAAVAEANQAARVRAWRDELTLALESLAYARSVLAGDVDILRHCLADDSADPKALLDELPRLITGPLHRGESSSAQTAEGHGHRPGHDQGDPMDDVGAALDDVDWTVCIRSDLLMTAHQEMARADLSSPEDVSRLLGDLEEQLLDVARRQIAVEGRLGQIRQAIVGQYETGTVSVRDWLG